MLGNIIRAQERRHAARDTNRAVRPFEWGADFDLYLLKWNGSSWVIVASSESVSSNETISYTGTAGYYMWQIYSYSGSGSYNFWRLAP